MTEGGLCALHEGLADIGDSKGGFVGGGDVVVDHGGEIQGNVVFCHADLLGYLCQEVSVSSRQEDVRKHCDGRRTNDLDLNIDLDEPLGKRVDLDETWINCAVEPTEFRD